MNKKERLFSVTKDDFDFQYYRGTGAGGQKRNKTSSACRCVHRASGAVGASQDGRSQSHNRETAFRRCVETQQFQLWLRMEVAARMKGYADAERMVDEHMREEYLKIEYYDPTA